MMRFAVALSLMTLLGVACRGSEDKSKTPSGGRASCAADADCAVIDKVGCCAACPEAPRAIPAEEAERQKNKCAEQTCPPLATSGSSKIECPNVPSKEGYVAVCREGTCAAVKR